MIFILWYIYIYVFYIWIHIHGHIQEESIFQNHFLGVPCWSQGEHAFRNQKLYIKGSEQPATIGLFHADAVDCQLMIKFLAPNDVLPAQVSNRSLVSDTLQEEDWWRGHLQTPKPGRVSPAAKTRKMPKGIVEWGFRIGNWQRLGNYRRFLENWTIQLEASCSRQALQTITV